jgi:hypothetical protein
MKKIRLVAFAATMAFASLANTAQASNTNLGRVDELRSEENFLFPS